MSFNIEKLMQVAKPVSENVKAEATFRKENKEWLRKSAKIALAIRRELRLKGMTQQDLAVKMALSPQYVGRILKGQENLTLETISKLEVAVGKQLFHITSEESRVITPPPTVIVCFRNYASEAWNLSSPFSSRKDKQLILES